MVSKNHKFARPIIRDKNKTPTFILYNDEQIADLKTFVVRIIQFLESTHLATSNLALYIGEWKNQQFLRFNFSSPEPKAHR